MTRVMLVAFGLAVGALSLTGCAAQGPGGPSGPSYSPYDESSPNCGVFGDCVPLRTRPYDMRGNPSGGA